MRVLTRNPKSPLAGLLLGFTLVTPLVLRLLPAAAATFTVTTTADAGPGSLRAAIEAANAAPGADTILFRIPTTDPGFAGGVFTIRPASELPAVQGPTFLDGFSQTGFTGNTNPNGPEIVLNGAQAGTANGLVVTGPNSVLRDLVVNGFSGDGIFVDGPGATGNRIEGCYVGTNPAGTTPIANGRNGIEVFDGADRNRIGGTEARARNVLSGNGEAGLLIFEADANVVLGNYLGINAAGTAAVPNQSVGLFVSGAQEIRIGGTEPGSRNLVSGNRLSGIVLEETLQSQIRGNYIGTDVRGELALPNGQAGVEMVQVSEIVIGGTTAAARNVISGNQGDGAMLAHVARNCRVQGNYIGLNAAGTAALPNRLSGVALLEGVDNLIGGPTASARNLISGNGANGVELFSASEGNQIQGNYIGTNPVGRTSIPNGGIGVFIADGSQMNLVGGTTPGARNLISGNTLSGVRISGESVTDPLSRPTAFNGVQGNFIGTDYSGDRVLPNGGGVDLISQAARNTIGGTTSAARNLISGNIRSGVTLSSAPENLIAGNYIGTNLAGSVALPNGEDGITLSDNETVNNQIGGVTTGARNLISGNRGAGVFLGSTGDGNQIQGNYIGTNANGSGALPNRAGVSLLEVSTPTEIGGSVPGAGNLISGNLGDGVELEESAFTSIRGNFIGTNATGTAALPNDNGIESSNAGIQQIGGPTPAERNLISGNRRAGLLFAISGFSQVQGNYIGVNASGTAALPNALGALIGDSVGDRIGGTDVGSRNLISGNLLGGIIFLSGTFEEELLGNYIGTNAAGTAALANGGPGVALVQDARDNQIGSPAAGGGNLISGNAGDGVLLLGDSEPDSSLHGNRVQGNQIGTTALGSALPNRGHGVEIAGFFAQENQIGGTEPGAGNRIAFNLGEGVLLQSDTPGDDSLVGNSIRANSIHDNRGLGINLRPAGEPPSTVTPNDFQDPDPGPNLLQNFPVLTNVVVQPGQSTVTGTLNSTPDSPFALDFFRSPAPDPSGYGEGQQYLGSTSVTTDASGNASFTFVATGTGAGEAGFFTATATNTDTQNTGEFSAALQGSSMTLAAGSFPTPGRGLAVGSGQIAGQVTDATGAAVTGVRLSLHQPTGGELYSREWDPGRLQVTHTDAGGAFRFTGLPRGRYLVLAYSPGVYFTPRARWVEVGAIGAAEASFMTAGIDPIPPVATITAPSLGRQVSSPSLAEGTAADAGGAGVRAVLVRLRTVETDPAQSPRWLDWQTGTWDPKPAPGQTRWAVLDATRTGWKLDLPHLAPGQYRMEVQVYDWAGYASPAVTTPFRVR